VTALVKVDLKALGELNVWVTGTVFFNGDFRLEGHTKVDLGVSEPTMNVVIGKAHGKPYAYVSFT
jgi:hypothetical protein